MRIVLVFLTLALLPSAVPAEDPEKIAYRVHDGYFVSNRFEPDQAESFVIAVDQPQFDAVFGSAFVMRDKAKRLPADAFATQMVVAAVHRGMAFWEYEVAGVNLRDGVLEITYRSQSKPDPSASFACPLIISIPKGKYSAVKFIENGKAVKRIAL